MIIKNVSSRPLRLYDFPDIPLIPTGGTADLSKYSVAERDRSDELRDFFERGLVICLGFAPTVANLKVNSLLSKATSTKVTAAPFSRYKVDNQPALNTTLVPKQQVPLETGKIESRRGERPKSSIVPNRYDPQALEQYKKQVTDPTFDFIEKEAPETSHQSFVQVQNEDQVYTLTLDEKTGTTYVQSPPGTIPTNGPHTSVFVDKNIYSAEEDDIQAIQEKKAKTLENLKRDISTNVKKICMHPMPSGRPCVLEVIPGYNHCFNHFSKDEKEVFDQKRLAKKQKEVEKDLNTAPLSSPTNDTSRDI